MPPETMAPIETKPMTLDVTIGPITFKVTDIPEMHTVLVTKIVQSFIANGIIAATMGPKILDSLKSDIAVNA